MQPGDDVWYKGEHYVIHSMYRRGKIYIVPKGKETAANIHWVDQSDVSTTPPPTLIEVPSVGDLLVQRFKLVSAMDSAIRSLRNGKYSNAEYTLAEALERKLTPPPETIDWKEKYEALARECTCKEPSSIGVGDLLAGRENILGGIEAWYDFPRYRVVGFHCTEPKMFVEVLSDSGKVIHIDVLELSNPFNRYRKMPMTWYKKGATK